MAKSPEEILKEQFPSVYAASKKRFDTSSSGFKNMADRQAAYQKLLDAAKARQNTGANKSQDVKTARPKSGPMVTPAMPASGTRETGAGERKETRKSPANPPWVGGRGEGMAKTTKKRSKKNPRMRKQ